MVYFANNKKNIIFDYIVTGISGGILLSSSIWSLLVPAIKYSEGKIYNCVIGFSLGYLLIIIINKIFKKMDSTVNLALAIHNIPEGMSVGVFLASGLLNSGIGTIKEALVLAIGIAIQNFPEGSLVSLYMHKKGLSKNKSFLVGCIIGSVELMFTVLTIIFSKYVFIILPFSLCFAGGTMIYTVLNEIFDNKSNNYTNIGFLVGFILMLVIDVYFG